MCVCRESRNSIREYQRSGDGCVGSLERAGGDQNSYLLPSEGPSILRGLSEWLATCSVWNHKPQWQMSGVIEHEWQKVLSPVA